MLQHCIKVVRILGKTYLQPFWRQFSLSSSAWTTQCFVKINISAKNPLQVMQQCHVALFTVPYCTGRWCSCCRQLVWRTSQCKRTGDDGSASRKRAEDPMRTSPFLTSYVSLCYKITSYIFICAIKFPAIYIFSLRNKMTDLFIKDQWYEVLSLQLLDILLKRLR